MRSALPAFYYPLGDQAIVIQLGDKISEDIQRHITSICSFLEEYSFEGFIEYVPAFTTVTIFYDPLVTHYGTVEPLMEEMLEAISEEDRKVAEVTIEIPVLYGGPQGPDLSFVAAHAGITESEVIDLHTSAEYLVHMIGFAPRVSLFRRIE